MSEVKTVVLSKPITVGAKTISEMRFRPPKFADYMELGEPETMVGIEAGAFFQEDIAVILKYVERLLVDGDVNYLQMLCLRDTLVIKREVLGFFRDATRTNDPTPDLEASGSGSPENLSSDAAKTLEPSRI